MLRRRGRRIRSCVLEGGHMSSSFVGEDLVKEWSLSFADIDFVNAKAAAARLGFSAQLKFFAARGVFAETSADLAEEAVSYLAEQLGGGGADLSRYDFSGRSGRRHCAEILQYLGFHRMKRADREALKALISTELCPGGMSAAAMMEQVFLWRRDRKIFGPSRKEMERLVRSERQQFLDAYLCRVADRLFPETVELMEASLAEPESPTGVHVIK